MFGLLRSAAICVARSPGKMPSRPSPVSTSMSTLSGASPERSALISSRTTAGDDAVTPMPAAAASRRWAGATRQRARTGPVIPASRSSCASSNVATSTARAPASSAARATGTAPRPYASAFSTTSRWPPAGSFPLRALTFVAIASSRTSTQASRPSAGRPASWIRSGSPLMREASPPAPLEGPAPRAEVLLYARFVPGAPSRPH